MIRWMTRTGALLALCACALSARPVNAADPCLFRFPADCGNFAGIEGLTLEEINAIGAVPTARFLVTPREALVDAIDFVNALADAEFAGLDLSVFPSEFVRQCLLEELIQIRALTSATTGGVSAANLAEFCRLVAGLRARLTQLRADGRINNCFFRLTCGFTSTGTLQRCPEGVRRCLTGILDALLRCGAITAECTGVAPLAFPPAS